MPHFGWFALMTIFALAAGSPAAAQDKRVALLIGNSDYKNATVLKNPVNDAADIGSALSRLGFSVTTLTNGTAEEMRRIVTEFGNRARDADIALVFLAGHAIEVEGMHWSIPVDATVDGLDPIKSQSVSLERFLAVTSGSKLTVVLIDTARDNPFEKEKPDASASRGNARPEIRSALVVYSTKSGGRPLDGEGRNSPFAAALLKHIETPGLDLPLLMRRVRDDVMVATKNAQEPFSYGSLPGDTVTLAPR